MEPNDTLNRRIAETLEPNPTWREVNEWGEINELGRGIRLSDGGCWYRFFTQAEHTAYPCHFDKDRRIFTALLQALAKNGWHWDIHTEPDETGRTIFGAIVDRKLETPEEEGVLAATPMRALAEATDRAIQKEREGQTCAAGSEEQ
jgi:hypothetical protein